jgi:hypothetical protein
LKRVCIHLPDDRQILRVLHKPFHLCHHESYLCYVLKFAVYICFAKAGIPSKAQAMSAQLLHHFAPSDRAFGQLLHMPNEFLDAPRTPEFMVLAMDHHQRSFEVNV